MNNKCLHMFSGLFISADGHVRLCCVSMESTFNKQIHINDIENLQEYFNSEYYISLRKKNFNEIDICNSCKIREIRKQVSMRNMMNSLYDRHKIYPSNINNCILEHLDISFNSMCNQQCLMCNSEWSSKWYTFDKKNTNTKFLRKPIKYNNWASKKNVDKIKKILPQIKLLQIKGGEPLIQKEVEDILLYVKNENLKCNIQIVSNFQHISDQMFDIICFINNISFNISLDSTGERYNWIRSGNWSKTTYNIEKYVKNCKYPPSFGYINTLNRWSTKSLIEDIDIVEKFNSKITKYMITTPWYNIKLATGPNYVSPMLLPREERLDIIYNFEKKFGFILSDSIQYKSLRLCFLKNVLSLENEQDNINEETLSISDDWSNIINGMRKK